MKRFFFFLSSIYFLLLAIQIGGSLNTHNRVIAQMSLYVACRLMLVGKKKRKKKCARCFCAKKGGGFNVHSFCLVKFHLRLASLAHLECCLLWLFCVIGWNFVVVFFSFGVTLNASLFFPLFFATFETKKKAVKYAS